MMEIIVEAHKSKQTKMYPPLDGENIKNDVFSGLFIHDKVVILHDCTEFLLLPVDRNKNSSMTRFLLFFLNKDSTNFVKTYVNSGIRLINVFILFFQSEK